MVKNKETYNGLRNLLKDLLTSSFVSAKLLGKAREAVPGNPCAARAAQHGRKPENILLTKQQRDWLISFLKKEYWNQLFREQQQLYSQGCLGDDCPFLQAPEPMLL